VWNERTQPTTSASSPPSILDFAIAGAHFGKPLKSRIRLHTVSTGALKTMLA
jgi:hypothetical protein